MKPPEDFAPTETRSIEQEPAVQSAKIEVAEISDGELEQYVISAQSNINEGATQILPEGATMIDSSAQSISASPEEINNAKQEFELDAQLGELQTEADQIAGEAKSEISSITETSQPNTTTENVKQTPEATRESRRETIIKEIEAKWEAQNGPMVRALSEREIEEQKRHAEFMGVEWHGMTTQLTRAGDEFYFDHKGMGKSSVPDQADKILAERFPEYATKQPPQRKSEQTKPKITSAEITEPKYDTGLSSTTKLVEILQQAGIESNVIKIDNGGQFPEAIILTKQEIPTEKMVRIYRGINRLDNSVLNHVPYAMRTENETGQPTTLEDVKQEVTDLAQNPTYENLVAYVDKVQQNLSPKERLRMDADLTRIEDGILEGNSTRKELIFKQIEHGGGSWAESGISPYISASSNPSEAAGYGDEGLMVIDVPLSEIEDFGVNNTEINLKGALDNKYITAILPRKRNEAGDNKKDTKQQLHRALQKVNESVTMPLYTDTETHSEREKKFATDTESDKEQQKKDVEKVQQRRIEKLAKTHPELKINVWDEQKKSKKRGVDIYTKVKQDIFDYYKNRMAKIGRSGRDIETYDFSESAYGGRKEFNREKTSDIMLTKLRELTLRLEEQEEANKK